MSKKCVLTIYRVFSKQYYFFLFITTAKLNKARQRAEWKVYFVSYKTYNAYNEQFCVFKQAASFLLLTPISPAYTVGALALLYPIITHAAMVVQPFRLPSHSHVTDDY